MITKNFSKTTSLDNLSYTDFKNLNTVFSKGDLDILHSLSKNDFIDESLDKSKKQKKVNKKACNTGNSNGSNSKVENKEKAENETT